MYDHHHKAQKFVSHVRVHFSEVSHWSADGEIEAAEIAATGIVELSSFLCAATARIFGG
jgi:hypothetical protein